MWGCKACGTQAIAGDLECCPACRAPREAAVEGGSPQAKAAEAPAAASPNAPLAQTATPTVQPRQQATLSGADATTPSASKVDTAESGTT